MYNENMTSQIGEALSHLMQLIGDYSLFSPEGASYDDDIGYIQEEYMQKLVMENFGDDREMLIEALKCEDYEE